MSHPPSLFRAFATVGSYTLLSRLTGFARDTLIATFLGAGLASDAFFPFPDSIEVAAKVGVKFLVQPGGSVKDPEVIAEANKRGLAMMFTGRRHFLH